MLRWVLIFLAIALISAVFGFGGIAGAAAGIAKFIFYLFVILFVVSLGAVYLSSPFLLEAIFYSGKAENLNNSHL